MNLLQKLEHDQMVRLSEGKVIPQFKAGDTVRVNVKVVEGERTRVQPYEGVVIGRRNASVRSTFRVRKLSSGEGVERVFHLFSPNITIELVRVGRVRRAKLYYLRGRTGKRARIAELKKPRASVAAATPVQAPASAE